MLNEYRNLSRISDMRDFCMKEGKHIEIKKDDFFFRKGEVSRYLGYINKGAFRYIDYISTGKAQVVGYSFPDDFVADYSSLIKQTHTLVYSQAIINSVVYVITRENFFQFLDNNELHLRRDFAESAFAGIYGRLISLYCDTPEERYLKVIREYPEIFDIVKLKEIASFIGITPETLSRIRKKMKSSGSM